MLTEGQLKITISSPEKAKLFLIFKIYVVLCNKNKLAIAEFCDHGSRFYYIPKFLRVTFYLKFINLYLWDVKSTFFA